MKLDEAIEIIEAKESETEERGFMVHFEKYEKLGGAVARTDYFPDTHAGEKLIETEEEAWELARRFAAATDKRLYVNIYVVNQAAMPVAGYENKRLNGIRRWVD